MIKYKDETVVGDFPKANNYIDDTQPRADRMFSSEKITTDFAKKSELEPIATNITPASGSTTEQVNCTYTVVGKMCIVTFSGWTPASTASGIVYTGLPKSKIRTNQILYNVAGGASIFYINPGDTSLLHTSTVVTGAYYGQIIYPIS